MIVKIDDLSQIRLRHRNEKIVLTSGTFDLFHVGHLEYLEQVKRHGDVMMILVSGDGRVKARKGPSRPIIPENDRVKILDSLKMVNYVMIDPSKLKPNETDPIHSELLRRLQPDFYVTDGPDPRFYNLMDRSQFIILNRLKVEPSTTAIVEQIKKLQN